MKVMNIGISNGHIALSQEHSHAYVEIIVTLTGFGTTIIGGESYAFHPGSIECIPAGVPHTKYAQQSFRDVFIGVDRLEPLRQHRPLLLADDVEKTVEGIMLMALRAYHSAKQSRVAESLADAVCEYIACMSAQTDHDDDVDRFKNHIIENYADPNFSIGTAERNFGYCTDHLRRKFKRNVGLTPIAYLNQLRLECACRNARQARDGTLSVANLALMSGFYDAHYFARLFKKRMGMTPSQYMTTLRESD